MILLFKNTFRKIKKSIGRFLSIMLIIALGISVFMGLREATAGMLYTADHYYDENNLMDYKITSTYGLNEDDVESIKRLNNVEKVLPSYSIDVIDKGDSIRIHAIEEDINNVDLVSGRMPLNEHECVADYYRFKLNDVIKFERDDLQDFLSVSESKVVGLVKSPLYIREDKGISNIGNGKLISFAFIKKDAFISKYYTEVYVTAKDSKEANSYYEEYELVLEPLDKELKKLKPIRETIRYEEVLKKASDEIIKIKKEVDSKLNESLIKLEDAKKELDSGKRKLDNTKRNTIKEFETNRVNLNNNKKLILDNLKTLGIKENEIDGYISNLSNTIKDLKESMKYVEPETEQYEALNYKIIELEKNLKELSYVKSNLKEIDNGLIALDKGYKTFINQISKEEEKIKQGYYDYQSGMLEYEEAKEDANLKIEEAKEELNKIEKPIWYLLERKDNNGYMSYKEDILKVDDVARLLPVFFILIVILMISNTLTRLIEEERTEIGILQSNGFSRSSILIGYLAYVLTSGLIGIGIGLTVGYTLVPKIIYSAFLARYYVPKLITVVSPLPFSLVIAVTLFLMIIVTIAACIKELKQVPAVLLRPKPPKVGKKVFLENFNFIWNRLSFMWKTTIRNIFRYKKRIIMTVLGVAGCTSLLISGLGINDSVNTISKLQYRDIIKYDSMYILKNKATRISEEIDKCFKENGIVNPLLINQSAYTFKFDGKTEDVYLVMPSDTVNFNNYVNLTSVKTDKKISINNHGAVITKQIADHLDLDVGDSISIRNTDNELFILHISDITYNYVSHYIYISKEYYSEVFKSDIDYNSIIANGHIDRSVKLNDFGILTVNQTNDIIESFDSFIEGLNKIIIMIVVFASFLAFIVLYNLTIINVSERKREIATFKVLGFYDNEVSGFVYRETLILTITGILVGLLGGIYMHQFIMDRAVIDNILFLRKINISSFVFAGVATIIFSVIIQLVINRTLKKIDMIDSLKSTE